MSDTGSNAAAQATTNALRQLLHQPLHASAIADYLFLEAWERAPSDHAGVTLRARQIRRANPALAEAIRAEVKATACPAAVREVAPAHQMSRD